MLTKDEITMYTCSYALDTFPWQDFFPDISLTIPWLLTTSLTFPWHVPNSLTFPGFPDKWSPCLTHSHRSTWVICSTLQNGWETLVKRQRKDVKQNWQTAQRHESLDVFCWSCASASSYSYVLPVPAVLRSFNTCTHIHDWTIRFTQPNPVGFNRVLGAVTVLGYFWAASGRRWWPVLNRALEISRWYWVEVEAGMMPGIVW